jgi:NagD protein
MLERAVHHVRNGAKLIGTNRDIMDRVGTEVVPSTGALVAPIELMTNSKAYFIGKPNPLIVSYALQTLQTTHNDTVIIGDRMDTDIQAGMKEIQWFFDSVGIEFGIDTVLVLSGVTNVNDLKYYGYKPKLVLNQVKDLLD